MKTLGIFILLCPFVLMGQMIETTLEELTSTSHAIVIGTCVDKESFWNDQRDKIFTRITIKADQYLKGDLGEETIITMPGGRVGDIIYEVSDIPLFDRGEEMVAFLWRHPQGITMVNGGLHGKKLIRVDKKTGKKMIQEQMKDETPHAEQPAQQQIPLDDFIQSVRRYLKDKE